MKPRPHIHRAAFTMIEILVVVAIMGILMAVSIPAIRGMLDSNNMTRAGQTITDQISLARQIASARNKTVEIRLIKFTQLKNPTARGYSAIQLWCTDDRGNLQPYVRMTALPDNTVVAEDITTLSPALEFATTGTLPPEAGPANNAAFASLQIRPSGIITPTIEMKKLYLTIVYTSDAASIILPKNYITIQINPNTGTPLIYRP